MNVDIAALRAVEKEKGIELGSLIDTLESALLTAYRHTQGHAGHAGVEIDRKSGEIRVCGRRGIDGRRLWTGGRTRGPLGIEILATGQTVGSAPGESLPLLR